MAVRNDMFCATKRGWFRAASILLLFVASFAASVVVASPTRATTTQPTANSTTVAPTTTIASGSGDATSADDAPVLRVSTKKIEPFVNVAADGQLSGYSIDLWDEVAKRLDLRTEWVVRSNVKEVVADVAERRSPVGIAGISMTPEREKAIDFSYAYFDSGLQILARKSSAPNPLGVLWKTVKSRDIRYPFGLMFMFAIIVAHFMWFVERRHNPDFPKKYLPGLWEGFWWASVNVFTGGDAEKKVNRLPARLIALGWMVMGVLLIAYVTGAVASALTLSQLRSDIASVKDLGGKRVVTTTGSVSAEFLRNNGLPFVEVDALDSVTYDRLVRSEIDAIVFDSPTLRFAANRYGSGKLAVVGPIFQPDKYGIALEPNSPLRERVNTALLEIQRDGTAEKLVTKWFGSA